MNTVKMINYTCPSCDIPQGEGVIVDLKSVRRSLTDYTTGETIEYDLCSECASDPFQSHSTTTKNFKRLVKLNHIIWKRVIKEPYVYLAVEVNE